MRRGHPWLVDRALWPELLALQSPYTLRDFLTAHAGEIRYLDVDTDSILQDLDTPEDYTQQKPK
jgi:molybdenum cofactor cytidylyltransferase